MKKRIGTGQPNVNGNILSKLLVPIPADKSSSIEPELEKHKIDDVVTVDKKQNNNDIQRSEEEDNKQQ